jgi:XTP/dITP diphosphohydrolase
MRTLLIATRNNHKTAEFRVMLEQWFEVSDLTVHPELPVVKEIGTTFCENAAIKAMIGSTNFTGIVLADDSGLEVDALGGAPGVYSARFAGVHATDEQNRLKLLEELNRVSAWGKARTGRFHCVLAIAESGRLLETFEGTVEGTIIHQPMGEGGFGYDSLFVPEGYCETFAQLDPSVKNRESHRGRALAKLVAWLEAKESS